MHRCTSRCSYVNVSNDNLSTHANRNGQIEPKRIKNKTKKTDSSHRQAAKWYGAEEYDDADGEKMEWNVVRGDRTVPTALVICSHCLWLKHLTQQDIATALTNTHTQPWSTVCPEWSAFCANVQEHKNYYCILNNLREEHMVRCVVLHEATQRYSVLPSSLLFLCTSVDFANVNKYENRTKLNEIYSIEKWISSGWWAADANANPSESHFKRMRSTYNMRPQLPEFTSSMLLSVARFVSHLNEIWCAHRKITIIHSRSTRCISLKHKYIFRSAAISMRARSSVRSCCHGPDRAPPLL